jgi:hypothetical protein
MTTKASGGVVTAGKACGAPTAFDVHLAWAASEAAWNQYQATGHARDARAYDRLSDEWWRTMVAEFEARQEAAYVRRKRTTVGPS